MKLRGTTVFAVAVTRLGAAALACALILPAIATGAETRPFGIAGFTTQTTEPSAASEFMNEPYLFTQAGGHPFALTTTVTFASEEEVGPEHLFVPTRDLKDMVIDLPPGLIADPQAVPQCSMTEEHCRPGTQVGSFMLRASLEGHQIAMFGPIVNLVPQRGESAMLGLEALTGRFLLTGRVIRTAEGYVLSIAGHGLPALGIVSLETTLWGVPAESAHDPQRGLACLRMGTSQNWTCGENGNEPSGEEPKPFLTMPSNCSNGVQTTTAWADSWEEQGRWVQAQATLPAMAYCERSLWWPKITVRPDRLLAEDPVAIDVSIGVGQTEEGRTTVAAPELRDATVTLPPGISINPGVGNGAKACSENGPQGIDLPTGLNGQGELLDPGEVGEGEESSPGGEPQLAAGHCPGASVIGTTEARTPLLPNPIEGRVYLATPECGGSGQGSCTEEDAADGKLYRIYVELGGRGAKHDEGVVLKVEGDIQANPATGQLTVELTNSPQLPLNELSIKLFGGSGALLTNPGKCGPATTTSDLEPWSAPFIPNASPSSYYEVTGCENPVPLNPQLLAGTTFPSAGAFSPLTIEVTREDREQYLSAIQLQTPPGLSAMLSSVPLCQQAAASVGDCPEASRIGSSTVSAGSGWQPLYMKGEVYLTVGYDGAPFGLSIVTDAAAGSLNLGLIVIRARIEIDPQTAALTITSDPLPQILLGIPLRLQGIKLDIDRANFIFNPTNCKTQQINARIEGSSGGSAELANRFAVGGCYGLAFKPKLEASTSARTSIASGASFDIKLAFPELDQGTAANLARVRVALPRHLPSRLTTLQGACVESTFEVDPSACPGTSVVGIARARTPVLSSELRGPVYLVSHGRGAFPSPIAVLQDDDIRLDLASSTTVDNAGISEIAFNAIPDMPLVDLELYLPQGPHSMLSANTSLCPLTKTLRTTKLKIIRQASGHTVTRRVPAPARLLMPTELVAQNGAVIHQDTKIKVTDCGKNKNKTTRHSHP